VRRRVRELTGEVGRLRKEKEEHEGLSTALREELGRAQEENRKLKDYIAEKEKKAGA
jgi:hypothetical protein